jgi:hypothetical protein
MKPGPILLFVVLAVGGGYLLYLTNSPVSTQEGPQGAEAAATANPPSTTTVLSNDERSQAPVRGAGGSNPNTQAQPGSASSPESATSATAAQAPAEESKPIEVEGSLPSVRPAMVPTADERELAQRYAGASSAELLSAYQTLNDYYQMHFDGRIADKSDRLAPEALEALQHEMAWLKERAINGKPDSDG